MDIKDEDHDAGLAVEVDSLVKRYGELVAVDGLSLTIPRGQVLGLLGRTARQDDDDQLCPSAAHLRQGLDPRLR